MIKKQLPFRPLNFKRRPLGRGPRLLTCSLAEHNERKRIPCAAGPKLGLGKTLYNAISRLPQIPKNGMMSSLPEPVCGVTRIRLLPMQNRMPEAALMSVDVLGYLVGFIETGKV